MTIQRGSSEKGDLRLEEPRLHAIDHFASEMDHFSECVLEDKKVRTPGEMELADQRIIEAVERAYREGVQVGL